MATSAEAWFYLCVGHQMSSGNEYDSIQEESLATTEYLKGAWLAWLQILLVGYFAANGLHLRSAWHSLLGLPGADDKLKTYS